MQLILKLARLPNYLLVCFDFRIPIIYAIIEKSNYRRNLNLANLLLAKWPNLSSKIEKLLPVG